ncbi:DUF1682-domain-containing protein [Mytilinidion resinicola]|uniref:DUF1682-domain-containing protein n=1 Tax=Mytilinidion resinicola TaxID=574789 RepID=A0A6A6Y648_9PEZI|nr:DUF1682-domain-containing protein [Mytilinidion resinicola]KAF2803277.1 DUF1682-domain-containing protein [Mytilinidion resinicola]
MADIIKGFFGGPKSAAPSAADDDFADFAGAPSPVPVSSSLTSSVPPSPAFAATTGTPVPYTAWYRVWERTTINDFRQEMYIAPFILLVILVHVWGTKTNRRKARGWITSHAPILHQEFALVGFGVRPKAPTADDVSAMGLRQAAEAAAAKGDTSSLLKEKAANEFTSYATGRQNVAFVDFKISMYKRYNPLVWLGEVAFSLFFESLPAPEERVEATLYLFDGRETKLVPGGETLKKVGNSHVDGFVWGIVHKDLMRRLREDRYDLSLTTTKDHEKLPVWATIMSESAEVTTTLLTPELIKAVEQAGELLEALVISDQPQDQPKKLDDTIPKKRISLSMKLPSNASDYEATLPIFQYFLRMSDHLASVAHFRPEAMRRIRQTREDEIRKIKKVDEQEKAEERKLEADKAKKEKRENLLKGMSADEQRKFLEKEREKDMRRSQKKTTVKG